MKELDLLLDKDLFNDRYKSLKDISVDKSNNQFLVQSELRAIDFDGVKTDYYRTINLPEMYTNSADALFIYRGKLFMVEFKNGKLHTDSSRGNMEIRTKLKRKMLHSLLMFCDITDTTTTFTRRNMIFILVYNETKNKHKGYIRKYVTNKSNKPIVRFGLDEFPRSFYKDVRTLTSHEFDEMLGE